VRWTFGTLSTISDRFGLEVGQRTIWIDGESFDPDDVAAIEPAGKDGD
jgi:hypothetical protein